MLGEVNSDGQALRTLVHEGRVLVSTLAQDPSSLGAAADQMAAVLRTTAGRQAELARSASLLAPGLGSARVALARVDRSVGTLEKFVRAAAPGVRELVPFSGALEPALREAPAALASADRLVRAGPRDAPALMPLLHTLRLILPSLEQVLGSANPVLDQLRVRLPDLFTFFANWADFTGDYDANGHAARVGVVFPPPPTQPISPCKQAPGVLLAPFLRVPGVLGGQPWTNYASSFIGGATKPAVETKAGC
jgi:phospholipid/cholesterol/gamma-HCH transport system substrate-binding protein